MRGDGDLTPTLPWLAAYSDWLDARVRRNAALTKFYYEVTVDNAEDARRRAALPLPARLMARWWCTAPPSITT